MFIQVWRRNWSKYGAKGKDGTMLFNKTTMRGMTLGSWDNKRKLKEERDLTDACVAKVAKV